MQQEPVPDAVARIFFDVDDTLLTWNWRLRPLTREVLAELNRQGFAIYIWSGMGRRWDFIDRFELRTLVHGVFGKPLFRYRERLDEFGIPFVPDYVVDDFPEIVAEFGGMQVPAPREPFGEDAHLLRVLHDIQDRYGFPRSPLAPAE